MRGKEKRNKKKLDKNISSCSKRRGIRVGILNITLRSEGIKKKENYKDIFFTLARSHMYALAKRFSLKSDCTLRKTVIDF